MAEIYASHYGLLPFAGTDNHSGAEQKKLAGMCCKEPIRDVADFIQKVKSGEAKIFVTEE